MPIRAVLLDAVGTAIYPAEDVAKTYAEFGRREGSQFSVEAIRTRFQQSFAQWEELDARNGFVTSESHEQLRWQTIVREVFSDCSAPDRAEPSLWDHYAQPAAWRVFADVEPFLQAMSERGIDVILASNFDARLRRVVAGLPPLQGLKGLAISSELGWRKPNPHFYRRILDQYLLAPEAIVAVGDSWANDVVGARSVGITAYLIDRSGRRTGEPVISGLEHLQPVLH